MVMRLACLNSIFPQNCGRLDPAGRLSGGGCRHHPEPCGFLFSATEARPRRHGLSWSTPGGRAPLFPGRRILEARSGSPGAHPPRRRLLSGFLLGADDVCSGGARARGVSRARSCISGADARLPYSSEDGMRSLNVAQAGAIVLAEALRQTKGFP